MAVDEGKKYDEGKPRLDLIPSEALNGLGKVLHYGATVKGYGARNWEKGMEWGRIYGALQRHLTQWNGVEDIDDESGLPHLYHAMAGISFLIALTERGVGEDTRK